MAEGFLQTVRREVERFQHRGFLEALMAVAALAAMADGEYGIAEKYRAEELLAELPIFDVFALRSDRVAATRKLETRVAGFAGSPDRARTLLRAAHAIIACDGAISAAERAEFERLARLLGLEPSELSLG